MEIDENGMMICPTCKGYKYLGKILCTRCLGKSKISLFEHMTNTFEIEWLGSFSQPIKSQNQTPKLLKYYYKKIPKILNGILNIDVYPIITMDTYLSLEKRNDIHISNIIYLVTLKYINKIKERTI
jgi:hypothetical protein